MQIKSFRAEKIRLTGLLAASATGVKLPPTLFIKGDETQPIQNVGGVHWFPAKKSWMNQNIFIRWIQFHFSFVGRNSILLVFDSARSHFSAKVKDFLHAREILFAVIPGGLTGLLQPCDVVWFKQLKDHIAEKIDSWKANPNHELTRNGNPKPPTNNDMSSWLSSGWAGISTERIANSFQRCFLGDFMSIHIAEHEVYGPPFRMKIALSTPAEVESIHRPEDFEESDVDEIDDV